MLGERTSQRVVEEVAADDAADFEAFAARKLQASYRIAALILGNTADAEDATHDAFVSAWRGWSTVRDRDRLDAWFGRILVNRCRDQQRKARRRRVIDISDALWALPADGDVAAETVDREAVARSFDRLSPDLRICVVLRYVADLTIPQIADHTGLPEGTVKSRLHRAMGELRIDLVPSVNEDRP